jgi:hypothetical protein
VIENDDRHFLKLQLPGGEETAVAGDDASLCVHQDRVVEAKRCDAGRDLSNLLVRVRSRIPRVRDELFEWPVLDALRHGMRKHILPSEYLLEGFFGGCALRWCGEPSL